MRLHPRYAADSAAKTVSAAMFGVAVAQVMTSSSHLTSPHLTSPHLTSPHLILPDLTIAQGLVKVTDTLASLGAKQGSSSPSRALYPILPQSNTLAPGDSSAPTAE
jgi:hypothetical protein